MARKIKSLYLNGNDLAQGHYHREHRSIKGRRRWRPDPIYKQKKQKLKEAEIE